MVKSNGDIMFSRWEHVGPRNRFAIFTAKPDGTNMFVLYGAHSPGNSFLHPREMDPAGTYKGHIASSLMSLSGTKEGGALMLIDVENFSENNMPANNRVTALAGQRHLTDRRSPTAAACRWSAARLRRIRCGTAPTACWWPSAPAR